MSNKPKTLSLVIPVYYNANSLPELGENLARCEKALADRGMNLEIILVNDGSGDEFSREIAGVQEETAPNQGHQSFP